METKTTHKYLLCHIDRFIPTPRTPIMCGCVPVRACVQVDANDRRSRRDMSPQGRKRAAMLGRDCRTISGIGQSYYNSQVSVRAYYI